MGDSKLVINSYPIYFKHTYFDSKKITLIICSKSCPPNLSKNYYGSVVITYKVKNNQIKHTLVKFLL